MAEGGLTQAELDRLETLVRRAERYVVASENLRPRVLEAARIRARRLQIRRKTILSVAAVALLCAGRIVAGWADGGTTRLSSSQSVAAAEQSPSTIHLRSSGFRDPIWALIDRLLKTRTGTEPKILFEADKTGSLPHQ